MRKLIVAAALTLTACAPAAPPPTRDYNPTITRDAYGVPTSHGRDDSEAAYGMALAHAEDNFATIQLVVLASRGKLGAHLGEGGARSDFLWHLLRIDALIEEKYETDLSAETRAVLQGYADGINAYGAAHRDEVLPGARNVSGRDVAAGFTFTSPLFWGIDRYLAPLVTKDGHPCATEEARVTEIDWGSNAFAVAPSRSSDGHTRLIVNSHQPWSGPVAWYEAGVSSDTGWRMHGGVFPGSPFPLLGTNGALGWAATVNLPDLADVYLLTTDRAHRGQYFYDGAWRRFETRQVWLQVKMGPVVLPIPRTLRYSVHGPVFETADGWVALRFAGEGDIRAVEQYYRMTRARSFEEWRAALAMRAIPSTNMLYGDGTGRIGFFYNAILPRRAPGHDWTGCVPGDSSQLVWAQGDWLTPPELDRPSSGWLYSANGAPWSSTDPSADLRPENFPDAAPYIDSYITNRGYRAVEILSPLRSISDEQLLAAKFDLTHSQRSNMAEAVRAILAADDADLAEIHAVLGRWDLRANIESREAALALLMFFPIYNARRMGEPIPNPLDTVRDAAAHLRTHFGRLDPPLGDVLRLRRGDVDLPLQGAPDTLRALRWTPDPDGRLRADFGDGLMMVMDWDQGGALTTRVIHQFGDSEHADSPHYSDQAPPFAREEWRTVDVRASH